MSIPFISALKNKFTNATNTTLGQIKTSNYGRGANAFYRSNSLVMKVAFLILVVIVFVLLIRWGAQLLTWFFAPSKNPKLVSGMKQGNKALVIPQDPSVAGAIPVMRSSNQIDGLEFTYTVWLFIDDLVPSGSTRKHIFHKGSRGLNGTGQDENGTFHPNNAPGLYIHPTRNTLIIVMNTFNNIVEEIEVNDIPMNKWINVAIRVEGNKMDVYMNGTIALRHMFQSVPKQNYGDVYINMNHGFSGLLSDLWYHDYALSGTQIEQIVLAGPDMTMKDNKNAFPNYLSLNWFFQNDEAPSKGPDAATWPTHVIQ